MTQKQKKLCFVLFWAYLVCPCWKMMGTTSVGTKKKLLIVQTPDANKQTNDKLLTRESFRYNYYLHMARNEVVSAS